MTSLLVPWLPPNVYEGVMAVTGRSVMFPHKAYLENPYDAADLEQGGGAEAAPKVETDRVKTLQSQVDDVKDIMTQNVDRMLARGERLDDLMDKSEDLQAGAQNFKHTSQKVARSFWWKNVKIMVVIIVVVIIIILVIVLLCTGVIPTGSPAPAPLPSPTKPTK